MIECDAVLEGLQLVIIDRRITIHRVAQRTRIDKKVVSEMVRRRAVPRAMAEAVHETVRAMYKEAGFQDPTPEFRVLAGEDLTGAVHANGPSDPVEPSRWLKRLKTQWQPDAP